VKSYSKEHTLTLVIEKMKNLTIATMIATLALGQPRGQPQSSIKQVVPIERVERSTSAHYSRGSYTFLFKENNNLACAYRYGGAISNTSDLSNETLEFEASRWNYAMRTNTPLGFKTLKKSAAGCYIISDMVWK
jgi:hypothetical protein